MPAWCLALHAWCLPLPTRHLALARRRRLVWFAVGASGPLRLLRLLGLLLVQDVRWGEPARAFFLVRAR